MSPLTPFTEPDDVLAAIKPLTDCVHLGLYKLLPTTRRYFESQGKPIDKSLHAMLTRYELKLYLLSKKISAADEEEQNGTQYSVRGLANCGLVINCGNCVFRVLKWHNCELPPSSSDERFQFYQGNLYTFDSNDPFPDSPLPPLNLVGAWNTNSDHDLASFSVVCPFGEVDNRVNNKWWRTLQLPSEKLPLSLAPSEAVPLEPMLDEITLRDDGMNDIQRKHGQSATDVKTENPD